MSDLERWADAIRKGDSPEAVLGYAMGMARAAEANRITTSIGALASRKAQSGSKAQAAGLWRVADARFEEARVLTEEVLPLVRDAGTEA